jgi:hypothetical protein
MYIHSLTKKTNSLKAWGLFLITLGSFFVIFPIFMYSFISFFKFYSISTIGIIISNTEYKDSDGSVTYSPKYQYTDSQGILYEKQSAGSSYPAEYKVGDKATIHYLKSDHSSSMLDRPANTILIIVPFIIGLIFLSIGIPLLIKHKREKIVWESSPFFKRKTSL